MPPDIDFRIVEEIYHGALSHDSAEQRQAYLRQHCPNLELRSRVEQLLAAQQSRGDFLNSAAIQLTSPAPSPLSVSHDMSVGPYKILEEIGEGGMGTVYMAEQTAPVRRRVALKVIKPGMDTRHVIARFEAERQALSLMDHPNIARVLDAGTTDRGLPYFVMELVRGMAITDYCDRERLPLLARFELFKQVCRAVHHAHQKGIIHRDLKPSNILVTVIDGSPVPKVIDFGVAKATGITLTERTLFTGLQQFVGTPTYMSPEQADLSGVDVDTRSDVYSLGILLYELLVGVTPIDKQQIKHASFDEIRRIVRDEEPSRPSACLSTQCDDEQTTVAENRKATVSQLKSLLRGEPDWIVMKCLEKQRDRRYESANALAEDVQHYVNGEPITAGPPNSFYRFRKLARKHRTALATCSLVACSMIVGTIISVWQMLEARSASQLADQRANAEHTARERAEANLRRGTEAVEALLTRVAGESLLDEPHMDNLRSALMNDALQIIRSLLVENPDSPAAQLEAGKSYRLMAELQEQLAHTPQTAEAAQQAVNILEPLVESNPESVECRRELAKSYHMLSIGYFNGAPASDEQREYARLRQLKLYEDLLQQSSLDEGLQLATAKARCIASVQIPPGDESLALMAQSIEMINTLRQRLPERQDIAIQAARNHWFSGKMYVRLGDIAQAKRDFEACHRIASEVLHHSPRSVQVRKSIVENLSFLIRVSQLVSDPRSAEYIQIALPIAEQLSREHPNVDSFSSLYFNIRDAHAHGAEEEGQFDHALDIRLEIAGSTPKHKTTELARNVHRMAILALRRGDHELAERISANGEMPQESNYSNHSLFAYNYLMCARMAELDPRLPQSDRLSVLTKYRTRAQQAIAHPSFGSPPITDDDQEKFTDCRLKLAITRASLGDLDGYHAVCQQLLSRKWTNPSAVENAALACALIRAPDRETRQSIAELAQSSMDLHGENSASEKSLLAMGMAMFHCDRFEEAGDPLRKLVDSSVWGDLGNTGRCYQAMCRFRLGQTSHAIDQLSELAHSLASWPATLAVRYGFSAENYLIAVIAFKQGLSSIGFEPAPPTDDPMSRLATFNAFRRIAEDRQKQGDAPACADAARMAIEAMDNIVGTSPPTSEQLRELAECHQLLCDSLRIGIRSTYAEYERVPRRLKTIYEELLKMSPDDPDLQFANARACCTFATLRNSTEERRALTQQSIDTVKSLQQQFPQRSDIALELAKEYLLLGETLGDMGEWAAAKQHLESGHTVLSGLHERSPTDASITFAVIEGLVRLCRACLHTSDARGGEYSRQAIFLAKQLVDTHPSSTMYGDALFTARGWNADLAERDNRLAEALQSRQLIAAELAPDRHDDRRANLIRIARIALELGDHKLATNTLQENAATIRKNSDERFLLPQYFVLCARVAERDPMLTAPDRHLIVAKNRELAQTEMADPELEVARVATSKLPAAAAFALDSSLLQACLGDANAARVTAQMVLTQNWNNAQAVGHASLACSLVPSPDAEGQATVVAFVENSLRQNPPHAALHLVHLALGMAYYHHGQFEASLKPLDDLIASDARAELKDAARCYQAMSLRRLGRLEEAQRCFDEAGANLNAWPLKPGVLFTGNSSLQSLLIADLAWQRAQEVAETTDNPLN